MRKPSLEDKIQERLKGYSVQVDNQKLFESLGISEQSEKKKRFLWWFSGFAGILIVAVGIFLIMQLNTTKETINQEPVAEGTIYYVDDISQQ